MSGKYSHIDHLDVLEIIKAIKQDVKIHNLLLNKDFFRASITNPANNIETKVGDISSVGIDLMNSENGHSSLSMGKFLYRYWCANGASHIDHKASFTSKAIHRGNTINNCLGIFSEGARWYMENGADLIRANFKILEETEVTERNIEKVAQRTEKVIGKGKTEDLLNTWKFREDRKEYESYQNNCFDLVQLVTAAAHKGILNEDLKVNKMSNVEQLGLERVGGAIYNDPKLIF